MDALKLLRERKRMCSRAMERPTKRDADYSKGAAARAWNRRADNG